MLLTAELFATSNSTTCSSQLCLQKFSNDTIMSSTLWLDFMPALLFQDGKLLKEIYCCIGILIETPRIFS